MFHKAVDVEFKEGTVLEVTFLNGKVKRFDMAMLFEKYPQLKALKNRELFESGKLLGSYGIVWNDELDIETETIYEEGVTVNTKAEEYLMAGNEVMKARLRKGLTQNDLARLTGIGQSDISKIERGSGNVSINTLRRIAKALNSKLKITIE